MTVGPVIRQWNKDCNSPCGLYSSLKCPKGFVTLMLRCSLMPWSMVNPQRR